MIDNVVRKFCRGCPKRVAKEILKSMGVSIKSICRFNNISVNSVVFIEEVGYGIVIQKYRLYNNQFCSLMIKTYCGNIPVGIEDINLVHEPNITNYEQQKLIDKIKNSINGHSHDS